MKISVLKMVFAFVLGGLGAFSLLWSRPQFSIYTLPSEAQATVGELDIAGTSVSFTKMYDNANSSYFLDPADSDTSLTVLGDVGIGTITPDGKLDVEGGDIHVSEIAAPTTPPAGKAVIYAKTDNSLYIKDDTGKESKIK